MFQKNGDFSKSDLERMLRTPEAQALLARLQQLDQAALQNAVDKAFRAIPPEPRRPSLPSWPTGRCRSFRSR